MSWLYSVFACSTVWESMIRWAPSRSTALAACLGCCWFLMLLLFVGGVMNLYWIAGLALYVLVEKMIPFGHRLGSLAGLALVVWGGGVIVAALR